MKTIMLSLLPAIFVWLGSSCTATAQVAQSDQITADNTGQTIQADSSTTGRFQPVTVSPSAKSDVVLQFAVGQGGKAVAIEPLDGGQPSANSATIDAKGNLSFSFQVTNQAGVYRVIVTDPSAIGTSPPIIGMVQFQVSNPTQ